MSDALQLEIRDSDGNSLRFAFVGRTEHEVTYLVAVDLGWVRASTEVSTYLYGPPTAFFTSLAESWRGWDGEKKWEDLEHRLGLTATSDRTGHITLNVLMQDSQYSGCVKVPINLEAGGLESIARRIEAFFESVQANNALDRKHE